MIELLQRLWRRKLVQWLLAYIAAAFALIQVVDVVGDHFAWPSATGRYLILALVAGSFVAVVLSWYQGERGAQRFGSGEVLIIALLLAVGGLLIGRFGPPTSLPRAAPNPVAIQPAGNQTIGGTTSVVPAMTVKPMPVMAAPSVPVASIAVLPFENLSSDKENAYFVSGMQDLILAKLADIGQLKVISRTSTMRYKSRPENLKTVAAELGVATIVEGSVQKQGKRVLINVQLIDTASDTHLWAETYQRTLDDIFGVEGEVAEKIATALNATLSPAQNAQLAAAPTTNKAAYDAFLRAEYLSNRGQRDYDAASWKAAIPLYREAIANDPGFALAYARLSWSESALGWFGGGGLDVSQLNQQARADAEQALKLAPKLAASHLALGFSEYYGKSNYAAAQKSFEVAMALRPNDVEALAACGYVQRRQGQFDAAIVKLTQALAHDPRNSQLAGEIGETSMMANRYVEAESALRHALALNPDNVMAKMRYSNAILLGRGDVVRALAVVEGEDRDWKEMRAGLLLLQRRYREALELLESIPDTPENLSAPWGRSKELWQANLYRLTGDDVRARRLYARELPGIRQRLKTLQGINLAATWLRIADAELGLGHTAAAMAAIDQARAIDTRFADHYFGPRDTEYGAELYAQARRPELAVPALSRALAAPGIGASYSPALLWLDPAWDPIRDDPRFQALLQKYAKDKPAVTYSNPPASGTSTKQPTPTQTSLNGRGPVDALPVVMRESPTPVAATLLVPFLSRHGVRIGYTR